MQPSAPTSCLGRIPAATPSIHDTPGWGPLSLIPKCASNPCLKTRTCSPNGWTALSTALLVWISPTLGFFSQPYQPLVDAAQGKLAIALEDRLLLAHLLDVLDWLLLPMLVHQALPKGNVGKQHLRAPNPNHQHRY